MKSRFNTILAVTLFSGVVLSSCSNDDDSDDAILNNPETITDLVLVFTDPDSQISFEVRYADADGPGGNAPIQDDIVLNNATVYEVEIKVEDRTNPSSPVDLTSEIEAEGDIHQFFYLYDPNVADALTLTYNPTDVDQNGHPIGLRTTWITSAETFGDQNLRVVLRHALNKFTPGASEGILTGAVGGETDIDVTFALSINP